jgi:hypothetical protein
MNACTSAPDFGGHRFCDAQMSSWYYGNDPLKIPRPTAVFRPSLARVNQTRSNQIKPSKKRPPCAMYAGMARWRASRRRCRSGRFSPSARKRQRAFPQNFWRFFVFFAGQGLESVAAVQSKSNQIKPNQTMRIEAYRLGDIEPSRAPPKLRQRQNASLQKVDS